MKTTEYKEIIEEYSSEGYFLYAGKEDDSELEQWQNREIASKYLEKYWLSENEYKSDWKPIQSALFNASAMSFPDLLFPKDFHIFPLVSGLTFNPKTLEIVKYLMKETGEKYFVLIQNGIGDENQNVPPNLKMKYPVSISWDELMSGGFISTVLYEMWHNDYFVFGSSGLWARYVANDYEIPVDLFGVKDSLVSIVEGNFVNTNNDTEELKKVIPTNYQTSYHIHF